MPISKIVIEESCSPTSFVREICSKHKAVMIKGLECIDAQTGESLFLMEKLEKSEGEMMLSLIRKALKEDFIEVTVNTAKGEKVIYLRPKSFTLIEWMTLMNSLELVPFEKHCGMFKDLP